MQTLVEDSLRKHVGLFREMFLHYALRKDVDDESGVNHLGHAIAGLNILLDSFEHGTMIDDRPAGDEEILPVVMRAAERKVKKMLRRPDNKHDLVGGEESGGERFSRRLGKMADELCNADCGLTQCDSYSVPPPMEFHE